MMHLLVYAQRTCVLTNGLKARTDDVTELNWTDLMYASTNDQWARSACLLVSSSKTKPCQFSSVTSLCTLLQTWLDSCVLLQKQRHHSALAS